jgi:hypothetical protein
MNRGLCDAIAHAAESTHRVLAIRLLCQASRDSHSPLHDPCFHFTPDQAHELISELNRVLRTMEIDQKGRANTS